MPEQVLELVYWKMRGAAQIIRNLLEYLQQPYKETNIDMPKVMDVKAICHAMHSLPILKDGDFTIVEVVPIAKYICRKFGRLDLLGETAFDEAKIEETLIRQLQFKNSLMMEVIPKDELSSNDSRVRARFHKNSFRGTDEEELFGRHQQYGEQKRMGYGLADYTGFLPLRDEFCYQWIFSRT